MDALKCLCPACNLIFEVHPAQTVVTCPICDTPVGTRVQVPAPVAAPAAPSPVSAGGRSRRGLVALGIVAFLAVGIGLAVREFSARSHPRPASVATHPAVVIDESPLETDSIAPSVQPFRSPRLNPQFPPPSLSPPAPHPAPSGQPQHVPVSPRIVQAPGPAPGSLAAQVNQAIERGVAYLRPHMARMKLPCRYEGLAGLTLLECGVPPSDPVVQRIAASLRSQVSTLDQTYELATTIFFLDRLGQADDAPLIRLFAQRLIDGQTESGMWAYSCPISSTTAEQTSALRVPGRPREPAIRYAFYSPPISVKPIAPRFPVPPGRPGLGVGAGPAKRRRPLYGDHSNTQFALMALWIAQRHGVPAGAALAVTGRHFRTSQATDGGWGYYHGGHPTFSNTCAGLLGLAVEQGIDQGVGRRARPRFMPVDSEAHRALAFLGRALPPNVPESGIHGLHKMLNGRGYYALWSMERVGTVYGLERIGATDWYPWSAQVIVNTQDVRGGWRGAIDTCFALLVLRRSNLMPDLTAAITGRDPRHPANPPLATGRPKRPPENGVAQKPKQASPPAGVTARPGVPMPQGGIASKSGTRDPMPDGQGIAPRAVPIPKP